METFMISIENIRSAKSDLKVKAAALRQWKRDLKEKQREGTDCIFHQYRLPILKEEFRYQHVCYCLARGRTITKIENNSKEGLNVQRLRVEFLAMFKLPLVLVYGQKIDEALLYRSQRPAQELSGSADGACSGAVHVGAPG